MEIGLVMNSTAVIGGATDGKRYMSPAETCGLPGRAASRRCRSRPLDTRPVRPLVRAAPAAGDDWAPPGVEAHVIEADGFLEAYGIAHDGATLIRPDGIVGWRSTGAFERDELEAALRSIRALDVTPSRRTGLTDPNPDRREINETVPDRR